MTSPKIYFLLGLFLLSGDICQGEKILILLPVSGPSHHNVFLPIIKSLAEKGHDIVSISPVKSPNLPPNVRQLQPLTHKDITSDMPEPIAERRKSVYERLGADTLGFINRACEKVFKNQEIQDLIKNEKYFDLVLIDIYTNFCMLGLIPHFKASSIYVSTIPAPTWLTQILGNRMPTSFVPTGMIPYSDRMSLKERAISTAMESIMENMWISHVLKPGEALYRKYIPEGEKLPSISEISANVSMIFMNSHFAITHPRPLFPSIIEIGGIHTRPAKQLPKDMDDFLSGSGKDGFILFSLGSVVQAKEMPESTRKVFLNVFSRLKQRVIWKWETEEMPDLPKNVKLSKWLPQQDVLGHPNIRLFMSHGGLLSTQESTYHGVPILGIPIFADQDINIAQAERRGYAKSVEIVDITEEKLEAAILELINNPTYTKKVKELSVLVKDVPEHPANKAVYWTEYVLRHKGAPHLRSGAQDLTFIQYYLLDVAAIAISASVIALYLSLRIIKSVVRRVCNRKKENVSHFKKD